MDIRGQILYLYRRSRLNALWAEYKERKLNDQIHEEFDELFDPTDLTDDQVKWLRERAEKRRERWREHAEKHRNDIPCDYERASEIMRGTMSLPE